MMALPPIGQENVDSRDGGPLPMQFFSTWEVRKVPPNCMSRLCTLNITRLDILKPIEGDLQSVVLAISMKTPHRSLRSNELQVPSTGLMNITLNLTFALQYPHFFKRGGNILEIRLQRRKRYRNRTIRGYKTLLRGAVNMGLVLQKSFQGVVSLFSDKVLDHMANVTVGSITSVPTEMEMKRNTAADVSSEEEDDVISDDDTDSLENMDPRGFDEDCEPQEEAKVSLKQPSSVLRLLKLKAKGRHREGRGMPVDVTLGLEEEEEGVVEGEESVVLSSLSDSYEEDDDENTSQGQATPRPRLRPFFGSDTLSLISGTQMPGDIDGSLHGGVVGGVIGGSSRYDKRYGSLELAGMALRSTHSQSPSEVLEPLDMPESGLTKGRLWLLDDKNTQLQHVLYSMDEPLLTTPTHTTSSSFLSLLNTLSTLWKKDTPPFLLIIDEGHTLLASLIRAFVFGPSFSCNFFQFTDHMIMLSGGVVSGVESKDNLDIEDDALSQSQDTIADFLSNLLNCSDPRLLPIAQVEINTVTPSSTLDKHPNKKYIPFIYNVSIGPWDIDTKLDGPAGSHPLSSSPPSEQHPSEILLEYWNGKQKSSVKVRSIMITVVSGSLLNVSAIIRSKKTLRIRRSKDPGGEGTIMSLSASHLSCRSTNKGEELKACIDGVQWTSFDVVKLSAQWDHSLKTHLPVLTIDKLPTRTVMNQKITTPE